MDVVDVQAVESPWGPFVLVAIEGVLVRSSFAASPSARDALEELATDYAAEGIVVRRGGPWVQRFVAAVSGYFVEPRSLADLPIASSGASFQDACIRTLRASAPGALFTYGGLARAAGRTGAARAAAACLRTHPFDLVVPSHRVVTAKRELLGPAHVVRWKADLLVHEGVRVLPAPTRGLRVDPARAVDVVQAPLASGPSS